MITLPIMNQPRPLSTIVSNEEALKRFKIFNQQGGKFRVAILNICNLDCFFCHNEAMINPRRLESKPDDKLHFQDILNIVNSYTQLGGRQVNLTGGEPLAHPRLFELLDQIDKRQSRIVLNSNVVLGDRLLKRPKHPAIDGILASLHTTSNEIFQEKLGGHSIKRVMDNMVALSNHGYAVQMNYSLGPYNRDEFPAVLAFAIANKISLKAITLVRPNENPDFYGGNWVNPEWLTDRLLEVGGVHQQTKDAIGGQKSIWDVNGTRIEIKNIAHGRLHTDYCHNCPHTAACGEGIYGLRVGVDGLWKPCLLRHDQYRAVEPQGDLKHQILQAISAMVGEWENARYLTGNPV